MYDTDIEGHEEEMYTNISTRYGGINIDKSVSPCVT